MFGFGGCWKIYWTAIYCNTIDGMFQETTSVAHSWLLGDYWWLGGFGGRQGFDGSSLTIKQTNVNLMGTFWVVGEELN